MDLMRTYNFGSNQIFQYVLMVDNASHLEKIEIDGCDIYLDRWNEEHVKAQECKYIKLYFLNLSIGFFHSFNL